MKCLLCKKTPVFSSPRYCKSHFIEYFEKKVKKTIKTFKLLKKTDKIAVAVSGGKDSSSLLVLLHKLGYSVTGLAIDEGILGYRDNTLKGLKKLCKEKKIKLTVVSFKKEIKKSLDEILKKGDERPCTACGIVRRKLLNTYSKNFDVLATGHNLDDESQAVLMNLFKGNSVLLGRQGPVSGERQLKEFTKRVKPFYFCLEKEIMAYSYLIGLQIRFNECPYVETSFRLKIRDILNKIESEKTGTKEKIIMWFLDYKKNTINKKENMRYCSSCGEPSAGEKCNTCIFLEKLRI